MRRAAMAALAVAALAGCATAPGEAARPPAELTELFRMARAYQVSTNRRICADESLRPRLAAAGQRLEQARRRMAAAYGRELLSAPDAPIVATGDSCANPAAAAEAVANFEIAVERLEAGLARAPDR